MSTMNSSNIFWLYNEPITFLDLMNMVFKPILDKFVIVFIDCWYYHIFQKYGRTWTTFEVGASNITGPYIVW
jgi:hypothetical protein